MARMPYSTDVKSALAALRKKTGYTFANCKKALEMHNNDLAKAEQWLNQQAQTMGWAKATKLEGRATAQGLVGVLVRENIGAMVEINCETDFVARNDNFKNFVSHATKVCAQYTEMTDFDGDLWKLGFESEALRNLKLDDGKTLGDHLALLIGTVGENATVRRAICFKTNNELSLFGYTHPSKDSTIPQPNEVRFGRYGAIVAFRSAETNLDLQKNLVQHIIGMDPNKVGEKGKDEPVENKDDEKCLIHQEYLLDPSATVGEILQENQLEVVDFQRFECGEPSKNEAFAAEKLVN